MGKIPKCKGRNNSGRGNWIWEGGRAGKEKGSRSILKSIITVKKTIYLIGQI